MGLVGPGFVGRHHIDAVRRLGFVDVVAIAGSDERRARAKAEALGVPRAYAGFEALAADLVRLSQHRPNSLHGRSFARRSAGQAIVSENRSPSAEKRMRWVAAREAAWSMPSR